MKSRTGLLLRLAAVALTASLLTPLASFSALAESKEVRISYQYGLGFFPITVVLEKKLIEKHAKKAGLGEITVTGRQMSGAAIANDALLSGSIDIASGGVGGLLQMWDKTGGTVKGLISVNDMSFLLNTIDPRVKTLADYLKADNHKIALPAVKIGAHAIVLSMAAEKAFGKDKAGVLDGMTISLPHPEALAALKGGQSEVKSHFASLPFSYVERKFDTPKIHTVLSSYDVLGGPHNNTLLYTMQKWQDDNPKLAKVVFDAFVEAESWIVSNPKEAAAFFKATNKSTLSEDDIEAILKDKSLIDYAPTPIATMKFAEFLHKNGRLKKMPSSWKDYFSPLTYNLNGS